MTDKTKERLKKSYKKYASLLIGLINLYSFLSKVYEQLKLFSGFN